MVELRGCMILTLFTTCSSRFVVHALRQLHRRDADSSCNRTAATDSSPDRTLRSSSGRPYHRNLPPRTAAH
uniref:Putative secreted protein n=1 Tax=Anopheles marajoara TaxID=58244 RepID=A0A2M4CEA8_9DIPT